MPTITESKPTERGTIAFDLAPTDEDDNALTFGQLITPTWRLTDRGGTVINSRSAVAMTSLSVVLTGADLAVNATDDLWRVITFQWQYDSNRGDGLYFKDEVQFQIADLAGVS